MVKDSIYSPEIMAYLSANGYTRMDREDDNSRMVWVEGHHHIEFNGFLLTVCCVIDGEKSMPYHQVLGFSPDNFTLFVFLMHNWEIITSPVTLSCLSQSLLNLCKN